MMTFFFWKPATAGVTLHTFSTAPGYEKDTFPTLKVAEAHIQGQEHIFESGKFIRYAYY